MEAKVCACSGEDMNQTVKLYENDSYVKDFKAIVVRCEPKGKGYEVVLIRLPFSRRAADKMRIQGGSAVPK